ncbi:MAG: cysteine--tRNA ligase [Rhodospirillales bacterium]|jgi:cysteinyl-tRNA synthetase|nr:cysteine--tRNA ligase [Rhodospirillales bacterium]MBT4041096.1 cysteine--tRNA ligase [Rhodospirillales bacterium]MBT4625179.1 cysteine--tRNA ligase [Rhodospirillales bacterium]MBT5351446.1 cysteine--tRNA ligase [Rhodospirillales bacterium]MBT5521965.1 cysteine--tRNA ligase [Rhodospirillales bacterium]
MTLHVHNTLSRTKETFEPISSDHVRMYVCGPTVYNLAHIGNARPVVVFDMLARLLRRLYPKVTYVRNITDIDDKINAASRETGEDIRSITDRTTKVFQNDMAALGSLPPDVEPRCTDHVDQMIRMTGELIETGNAYEAEGHVLFNVPSMAEYGQLSRHSRDELIAGARVDVAPYKRDPADFVLWKPSDEATPGWDSPWGRGRPGWHIECSAMAQEYLGNEFDIHGGGQDLIFPHHENELAQSRCANHTGSMAKYWMHNGYLMAEGEKMSKSLGNFYTVHDLLDEFPGEAIRLVLLQTHYRQPLDFTKEGIAEAKRTLDKWYRAIGDHVPESDDVPDSITRALSDDLNTPKAITELHRLSGDASKQAFLAAANFMGLMQQSADDWFKWSPADAAPVDEAAIEVLITERTEARASKDFARSDEIRDELAAQGIVLEDGADGTTWKRKNS